MTLLIKNGNQFIEELENAAFSYLYINVYKKSTGFASIEEMQQHLDRITPHIVEYLKEHIKKYSRYTILRLLIKAVRRGYVLSEAYKHFRKKSKND